MCFYGDVTYFGNIRKITINCLTYMYIYLASFLTILNGLKLKDMEYLVYTNMLPVALSYVMVSYVMLS